MFESILTSPISLSGAMICTVASLVLGCVAALV